MIKLHGFTAFDRSAKVRWLLTELGLQFENCWLDNKKKEHEGAAFLKLNPLGRVPVLEMDGQVLSESSAICEYLADRHADRGMAPALSAPDRAEYLKWMYFAVSTLDAIQVRIMIIEDIPAGEVHTKKEAALVSDLKDALTALDMVLEKHAYLVANRFSAADICVSYHLSWFTLWPELEAVMKEFPRVTAYCDRLKALPSAVKAKVFSYEP